MKARHWAPVFAGLLSSYTPTQAQSLSFNMLLADHAVLQRDTPIMIEGSAAPLASVTVNLAGQIARTTGDATGRWHVALPALPAGGPYILEAHDTRGARAKAEDVMIGDVWLCSGQSNMELPVNRSLNAESEISASNNDQIRLVTIAHDSSPTPHDAFTNPLHWAAASPPTVAQFSAACYYFARTLQKTVHVPMGLIQSAWGGSNIEAWVNAEALRHAGKYDVPLALNEQYARQPSDAVTQMATMWQDWWHLTAKDGSSPWLPRADGDWRAMPLPWRNWKTWGVASLANYDGLVWFRRSVTLSAKQARQAAILDTGAIDEEDQTWINGLAIGNSFGWGEPRSYTVPAGVLHEGENTIVVNVYSAWDKGGMFGPADTVKLRLADGGAAPLSTDWRYWQPNKIMGAPPHAPWHTIGGLTGLYNAMIAPLGHPALKGVLWYQGESNTGNANQYEGLLDALKAGWRQQFGTQTPFLIVQLPNFGTPNTSPVTSGWAEVREAQRRSVARDPLAALAVTIDLGLDNELHPPNKQGVGERLARAARSLIYHEKITPSGPFPGIAKRQSGVITVPFSGAEGRLHTRDGAMPNMFELCGVEQASCTSVPATLVGDKVVLMTRYAADTTRVRYCWGDAPHCNLYDHAGLPAAPFEIAIK